MRYILYASAVSLILIGLVFGGAGLKAHREQLPVTEAIYSPVLDYAVFYPGLFINLEDKNVAGKYREIPPAEFLALIPAGSDKPVIAMLQNLQPVELLYFIRTPDRKLYYTKEKLKSNLQPFLQPLLYNIATSHEGKQLILTAVKASLVPFFIGSAFLLLGSIILFAAININSNFRSANSTQVAGS
ncbi:MAG: hypothetical protein HYW89_00345 [Candidatus Sungiibacteriota bacterium]|uniref:Uncharacterized protein n=1 Tax=Candidatus Sungiibacteriota bacterium TaxID=2750080 RepID=A0A7T5UQP1_9BACT|nr:MAG: hypothetical protein HYW89_00345 [Candidatus Sungbacteria bacterium]